MRTRSIRSSSAAGSSMHQPPRGARYAGSGVQSAPCAPRRGLSFAPLCAVAALLASAGQASAQCAHWINQPYIQLNHSNFFQGAILALNSFAGKLVIGGWDVLSNGVGSNLLLWNGATMSSIGTPNSTVYALKSYSLPSTGTNVLVVGGDFSSIDSLAANRIAYYSLSGVVAGGTGWYQMGAGFNDTVASIERFNNAIYAAGYFTVSGANAVARIARWDGSAWQPVGTGLNGPCFALAVYNGALYAGGSFTTAGGVDTGGFAKWDGTSWSALGGHFGGSIHALTPYNGGLAIGGAFPGNGSQNIAIYYSSGVYTPVGSGSANGSVDTLAADNGNLYAGGAMTQLAGTTIPEVGYWNGASWNQMPGGPSVGPAAIFPYRSEIIVAGGFPNFTGTGGSEGIGRWSEFGTPWWAIGPANTTACPYGVATFNVTSGTYF